MRLRGRHPFNARNGRGCRRPDDLHLSLLHRHPSSHWWGRCRLRLFFLACCSKRGSLARPLPCISPVRLDRRKHFSCGQTQQLRVAGLEKQSRGHGRDVPHAVESLCPAHKGVWVSWKSGTFVDCERHRKASLETNAKPTWPCAKREPKDFFFFFARCQNSARNKGVDREVSRSGRLPRACRLCVV